MKQSTKALILPWLSGILLAVSFCVKAEDGVIRVNEATDGNGRYAMAMVKLALSKVDSKYKFVSDRAEVTQARNIEDVATGKSDLLWAATNQETEDILLPIRIPLYKGLLGHRIFIINPASQSRFDRVKN
jgi:hypothetical protein